MDAPEVCMFSSFGWVELLLIIIIVLIIFGVGGEDGKNLTRQG